MAKKCKKGFDVKALEKEFARVGRDLFLSGAVTSHGGNLSVCDGKRIWITRTGSQLGRLGKGDVIETRTEPCDADANCSSELIVHRALYQAEKRRCKENGEKFGRRAIVHAHTLYTTYYSTITDEIVPTDSECKYLIPGTVRVVNPEQTIGSPEAAAMLAEIVEAGGRIGVIRNHGPFCIGTSLSAALQLVSSLEHSCKLRSLIKG